ncbi:hypothetical protein QTP88_019048 [Uroleucon formosanum]
MFTLYVESHQSPTTQNNENGRTLPELILIIQFQKPLFWVRSTFNLILLTLILLFQYQWSGDWSRIENGSHSLKTIAQVLPLKH